MKSIMVAGGAGYIGSHTVKLLKNQGYKVVVIDNLSTGHRELVPKDVPLVVGNVADEQLVEDVLLKYDVEAVIHFAANAYVGESVINPSKYYLNNVANGIHLLNAMIKCNVKNIVFSSTCATYGVPKNIPISEKEIQNPINPYGKTKLMMENILKDFDLAYGLKYVALRYFNAAGADLDCEIGEWHVPETHVIPLILEVAAGKRKEFNIFGNDYNTTDGTCIRDYIHVTDLADAHIKALEYLSKEHQSNYFNLGTGQGVSVIELIKSVEKITGKSIKREISDRRPGDPDELVADNKKAKDILGWTPRYSDVDTIIKTAWAWYNKGVNK